MFLANSLNDKLKRSLSDLNITKQELCMFPYQRRPQNPKFLRAPKEQPDYTSAQLAQLSKKEFEKKFTLSKLRQKWQEKIQINFDLKHKKFIPECTSQRAKTAKAYVKDLIDPDLFQQKQPRWNISSKVNEENFHIPLKKTIFEVTHGLNTFQVVPLKEKKIEPGIDVKYELITPQNYWNSSNKLEKEEKKQIAINNLKNALNNTQKYWSKTEICRLREDQLPIMEERKKVEEPRYYKPYMSPETMITFNYNVMNKIKEDTKKQREILKEQIKYENPGCEKFPEKIESIVEKKMYSTYKEKFDVKIGKKKEKKKEAKLYNWKDEELANKINTIQNWNDIDAMEWFKQSKTATNFYTKNFDISSAKRELLKPLVPNGLVILKEENNIRDKKLDEEKKEKKKNLMKKKFHENESEEPPKSKYPMDKIYYDLMQKYPEENFNTIIANQKTITQLNSTNKKDGDKDCFIQAYMNVIKKEEMKKRKQRSISSYKKNDFWIEYRFYHPGTYVRR